MAKDKKQSAFTEVIQSRVTPAMAQKITAVARDQEISEASLLRRYCREGLKRESRKLATSSK